MRSMRAQLENRAETPLFPLNVTHISVNILTKLRNAISCVVCAALHYTEYVQR
jgi:hypothetical protein